MLEPSFRRKFDATIAFVEAFTTRATLEQQRKAVDYIAEFIQVQHMRMKTGNTSEINYLESQLDELRLRNDLQPAEADATVA